MENEGGVPAVPAARNGNGARKIIIFAAIGVAAVVVAVFGSKWLVHRLNYTSTDDAQVDADLLPLSFKTPGRISAILVSEGDAVRAGQKLAELDSTDYELALEQAEARLEAAELDLEKARAALELTAASTEIGVRRSSAGLAQGEEAVAISSTRKRVNETKLKSDAERAAIGLINATEALKGARALDRQARADLERAENLEGSGVVSRERLEQVRTAAEVADARLAQAEQAMADAEAQAEVARANLNNAGIDSSQLEIAERDRRKAGLALELSRGERDKQVVMARASVKGLEARVRELRAGAQLARTALGETALTSPVDGVAARKLSQQSEIVAPGKPVLFVIDSSSVRVLANINEKFLGGVRVGARATVTVDALPGRRFAGRVKSIGAAANSRFSLIPQSNPSGQFIKVAQRIPVKISLEGNLDGLKPGMNAVVSIKK